MPGDPLAPVSAGDPLPNRAETFNQVFDAARDFRSKKRRGQNAAPTNPDRVSPAHVITVVNSTGSALGIFDVVELTDTLESLTDSPIILSDRPCLEGIVPTATTAPFAILLDGVANGGLVRAVVGGCAVVDVDIADATHEYATPAVGVTGNLTSAATGPVRILDRESGSSGVKRAVVLVSQPQSAGSGGGGVDYQNTVAADVGTQTINEAQNADGIYYEAGTGKNKARLYAATTTQTGTINTVTQVIKGPKIGLRTTSDYDSESSFISASVSTVRPLYPSGTGATPTQKRNVGREYIDSPTTGTNVQLSMLLGDTVYCAAYSDLWDNYGCVAHRVNYDSSNDRYAATSTWQAADDDGTDNIGRVDVLASPSLAVVSASFDEKASGPLGFAGNNRTSLRCGIIELLDDASATYSVYIRGFEATTNSTTGSYPDPDIYATSGVTAEAVYFCGGGGEVDCLRVARRLILDSIYHGNNPGTARKFISPTTVAGRSSNGNPISVVLDMNNGSGEKFVADGIARDFALGDRPIVHCGVVVGYTADSTIANSAATLATGVGVSGTFTTVDGKTITVADGIITSIV
jgi:hypothetical protein